MRLILWRRDALSTRRRPAAMADRTV